MTSRELIDAQFDRAVEIVQGLPKTGPIQTAYEEKLQMYSLYKQATVGNVEGPRPSVWDMLGRAKWDAWAKHKNLNKYEAKWLYVDALLKVLRKYPERTLASQYVRELESYMGDPSNMVLSGTTSRSRASSSSSSASSEGQLSMGQYQRGHTPMQSGELGAPPLQLRRIPGEDPGEESVSDDEEDERGDIVPPVSMYAQSQTNRPVSSLSSHRYRTPMAGSLITSPPPLNTNVPQVQPLPGYQTQSAFEDIPPPSTTSLYPINTASFSAQSALSPRSDVPSLDMYPAARGNYRVSSQPQLGTRPYALQGGPPGPRPPSRGALEQAVESVQAHLAALTERLELLEHNLHRSTASISPRRGSSGSPIGAGAGAWDANDMGMWSLLLRPLARVVVLFEQLMEFLAHDENRSPTLVIVRRLFLDISFLLCMLTLLRVAWRKSGMRRRKVLYALRHLWSAIIGSEAPRVLIDRGV